jgi:signal transduction histidine kinase
VVPRAFTRLTSVVALLLLTLAVAGALAWQAHRAARSHETVAARVQQDYVEFAGWEFSRAARQEVTSRLERWLQVIGCAASTGGLPEPDKLDSGPGCRCDDLAARTLFRVDFDAQRIEVTGAPLGPEAKKWVMGTLNGQRRIPAARHAHLMHTGMLDGRPTVIALSYAHNRYDAPVMVAGFAADPMVLAPAFSHVVGHRPLLPPSLAGGSNTLLHVSLTGRDGSPVFGTEAPESWVRTEGSMESPLDTLRYQVALSPEHADQLVIGGLPKSRLPLLLGLLGLTTVLLGVAVQQLRREHDLTRLRADFVASVSHELRTPLAQIRLFSETLLLGRVRSQDEARRSLEIIQQESRRLTHLVDNVLYFSRSERGTASLSPSPARLAAIAAELVEAFEPLARSGRSHVQLQVKNDVEAPVDGGAFRQIVLNLLDNAVKYGRPDQTITIGIDRQANQAVITVDDQGPGVPLDARERIWAPYSRLVSASSTAVAGAGIGLAVVRELVALHGGSVRVDDAPGGGARFVVELPGAAPGDATESVVGRQSSQPA